MGKSTVGKIQLAYNLCRLLNLANPAKTLGLARKPLSAVIFHFCIGGLRDKENHINCWKFYKEDQQSRIYFLDSTTIGYDEKSII